jgi:hypothetical protein
MARPRGAVAWAVMRAILQAGRATHRRVHGVLQASAQQLVNAGRYATAGAVLVASGRAATAAVVQRVLRTLANRGHLAPVGDERTPGARRPMRIYGMPGSAAGARAELCPLAQVMSIWGAPATS